MDGLRCLRSDQHITCIADRSDNENSLVANEPLESLDELPDEVENI